MEAEDFYTVEEAAQATGHPVCDDESQEPGPEKPVDIS
jgi:hypothetical protein